MCCGLLLVHWTTASFISTCPVIILVVSDKRTSAYFEPWLLQSSCEANAHGAKWLWTVSHFNIFTFHVVQASHIYSKWMSLNTNLHLNCFMRSLVSIKLKGALDKSNKYLFISSSVKDCKSNPYRKFQLILPMHFHFMRYFVYSIIFRVSHRLLYCVFIEVDFEK